MARLWQLIGKDEKVRIDGKLSRQKRRRWQWLELQSIRSTSCKGY